METIGVAIPKSTLATWCRNIVLPRAYYARVKRLSNENLKKARIISRRTQTENHDALLQSFRLKNGFLKEKMLDLGTLKMLLAILYLGEGAKWKSHRGLFLGNSDPDIVLLYISLLDQCYGIKPASLKCRICYRADQNIDALERYWSILTKIPLKNFYKTKPDARTVGIPTKHKGYKGVCVIHGGGTQIQLELDIIARLIVKWLAK
jgi:hypothetical protein